MLNSDHNKTKKKREKDMDWTWTFRKCEQGEIPLKKGLESWAGMEWEAIAINIYQKNEKSQKINFIYNLKMRDQ